MIRPASIRRLLAMLALVLSGGSGALAAPPTDAHGDALPPHAVARLGTVRWRSPAKHQQEYGYWSGVAGRSGYREVAISPDGKFVAALEAGQLSVWEAETGKLASWAPDLASSVRGVQFSPEGRTLLLETLDSRLVQNDERRFFNLFQRYEVGSGKLVGEAKLDQLFHTTSPARFTADGKHVLLDSYEDKHYLCDLLTGKPVRIVEPSRRGWRRVKLSADGGRLAMAEDDGHGVVVIDTATGKEVLSAAVERETSDVFGVTELALSADGNRLAAVKRGLLLLWEAASGERQTAKLDQGGPAAFSPDGKLLACGDQKAIRLFETKTLREIRSFTEHRDSILDLAFSADGRRLVSGQAHTVGLWDVATGKPLHTTRDHHKPVVALSFSPTGDRLASGSEDGSAIVWDHPGSKLLHRLTGHHGPVASLAFCPDGSVLATGEGRYDDFGPFRESQIRLWQVKEGNLRREFVGHLTGIDCLAWSPDGKRLASGGLDARVKVWDPATGQRDYQIRGAPGSKKVAVSLDGELLLVSGSDGELALCRAASGALVRSLGDQDGKDRWVWAAGFSGDGKRVWSVEQSLADKGWKGVRIWDVQTGREVAVHSRELDAFCVAVSPDGRLMAKGNLDDVHTKEKNPAVQIVDLATGTLLATLEGHTDVVRALAFSPDGKMLASGSADTTVLLWDLTATLQQNVKRLNRSRR